MNSTTKYILIFIICLTFIPLVFITRNWLHHFDDSNISDHIYLPIIQTNNLQIKEEHSLIITEKDYKGFNAQYFGVRKTMLKRKRKIPELWAKFDANWPCLWVENVVGAQLKFKDGVKWGCGLHLLKQPCVIYSFGSNNDWIFEEGILQMLPFCQIFTFDPSIKASKITMPASIVNNTHYFEIGIAGNANFTNRKNWTFKTLPSIMNDLNHTHIDILKIDVEGYEWEVFFQLENAFKVEMKNKSSFFHLFNDKNFGKVQQSWPSFGQILIEIHKNGKKNGHIGTLLQLIELFEKHGFRIFHKEVNPYFPECCCEYSFIQEKWRPNVKHYKI